jgi:delta-aminolevulinic acid dehydratase/porphobilinogen synthase
VDTSTHYGIIAQDVIETLKNYGVDSLDDFGGITHDKEEDTYGARPTEFVSILIKAIQELSDEVKELKEKN